MAILNYFHQLFHVSTLAVEWIEIVLNTLFLAGSNVSTLAVEWIEIPG